MGTKKGNYSGFPFWCPWLPRNSNTWESLIFWFVLQTPVREWEEDSAQRDSAEDSLKRSLQKGLSFLRDPFWDHFSYPKSFENTPKKGPFKKKGQNCSRQGASKESLKWDKRETAMSMQLFMFRLFSNNQKSLLLPFPFEKWPLIIGKLPKNEPSPP